jgi:uncharacterized damage-inducible protein DinB
MTTADALLPELDHEVAVTRKVLERVPEEQFDWKPHPKAFSLLQLASHLATLPHWGVMTLDHDEFNMDGGAPPPPPTSLQGLLEVFDANAAAFRSALAGKTDAELTAPWTLKQKGAVVFSMPKVSVLRSFVMNHVVHHRGQLTVYLRQLDVPVPSVYGPSADETVV